MGIILGLVKGLFVGRFKTIAILAVCAGISFALYSFYDNWRDGVFQEGVASQVPIIADLNNRLVDAKSKARQAQEELHDYQVQYRRWRQSEQHLKTQLKDKQNQIVSKLNETISQLQTQLQTAQKERQHEIDRYISEEADSQYHVPRGFVLLYNDTIDQPTH